MVKHPGQLSSDTGRLLQYGSVGHMEARFGAIEDGQRTREEDLTPRVDTSKDQKRQQRGKRD